MSGGVDSSVAALLLKRQGYEVHGYTLRMWDDDGRCCSRESIEAAVAVSRKLGIAHAIIDIREEFKCEVVDYFLEEYRHGRTPNPCAVCNQRVRFGSFWRSVDSFGAEFLSTGHYTRIVEESGDLFLARAVDRNKTQEYFLSLIPKERLSRILFPLGGLTKARVRKIAKENDLPIIDQESQDICFIPDGNTTEFLCKNLGSKPGDIVDLSGKIIGSHRGVWCYTVGQRKGLGISAREPLFVISVDVENNRVVVGPRSALAGDCFMLSNVNRFTDRDLSRLPLTAKIRYATPEAPCHLEGDRVCLEKPVDAITPGQLGVIYWEDKVVMAGIITVSRRDTIQPDVP